MRGNRTRPPFGIEPDAPFILFFIADHIFAIALQIWAMFAL